jgi:hypothetical protein
MGCFEDFVEFREAMERLNKKGRKEPDTTASDGCLRQSKESEADRPWD